MTSYDNFYHENNEIHMKNILLEKVIEKTLINSHFLIQE